MPPAGTAMAALTSWQCHPTLGLLVGGCVPGSARSTVQLWHCCLIWWCVWRSSTLAVRLAHASALARCASRTAARTVRPSHGRYRASASWVSQCQLGHIDLRSSENHTSSMAGPPAQHIEFAAQHALPRDRSGLQSDRSRTPKTVW